MITIIFSFSANETDQQLKNYRNYISSFIRFTWRSCSSFTINISLCFLGKWMNGNNEKSFAHSQLKFLLCLAVSFNVVFIFTSSKCTLCEQIFLFVTFIRFFPQIFLLTEDKGKKKYPIHMPKTIFKVLIIINIVIVIMRIRENPSTHLLFHHPWTMRFCITSIVSQNK